MSDENWSGSIGTDSHLRLGSGSNAVILEAFTSQLAVRVPGSLTRTIVGGNGVFVAAPNGVDDTAVLAAAITSASVAGGSFGGTVYLQPGLYKISSTITMPSNVRIVGAGKNATVLRKLNNIATAMLDFTGASNASRCQRGGLMDLKVDGNGFTGPLMRCKWADHLNFDRVWFYNNNAQAAYLENCWDTYFNQVEFDTCSSSDGFNPSVLISSNSDDSSNIIVFHGCRWENFIDGALWISTAPIVSAYTMVSGSNPSYGVYLTDCKMETPQLRGLHFSASADVGDVHFNGMYAAARGLFTGIVTGRTLFNVIGASDFTFEKFRVRIDGVTNPTVDKVFAINTSGQGFAFRDIFVDATQLPNTALMSWDAGVPEVFLENIRYKTGQAGVIYAGAAGTLNYPTIASAATTMVIPRGPRMIVISGTTTITTIPAVVYGTPPITFRFAAASGMTDGGNLKLAGNITGAADTTITLYCDGTNWIECGRSVN